MDKSKYLDKDGLPGTLDYRKILDMGDSAAIAGTLIALGSPDFTPDILNHFIGADGLPRRHPDQSRWYGQPDRFSRDQMIPLICAGIRLGGHPAVDKLYLAHAKRDFKTAWNTRGNGGMEKPTKRPDITGPEIMALWARYLKKKPLRLAALDMELLTSALDWKLRRKDRVCRNHMLSSLICREFSPTFVSKTAFRTNNWKDLIMRWKDHCTAVGEYQTAPLFENALKKIEL